MEGVSVITATYCERENLPVLIERSRSALAGRAHEIVVVDDSSPDGTYEVARKHADRAILVKGAGQTKSLHIGLREARYEIVVTLDADLENPPELIPALLHAFEELDADVLVASRTRIPRISEKLASVTLGSILSVHDVYSNFRVYKRSLLADYELKLGETFGGELLVYAWLRGCRIREILYDPPPRRRQPRIGGAVRANVRITLASLKLLVWVLAQGLTRNRSVKHC